MENKETFIAALFFSLVLLGANYVPASAPLSKDQISSINNKIINEYSVGAYPLNDSVVPSNPPQNLQNTPSKLDWRNTEYQGQTGNWLTPIKNQGDCGSCWAFAAIAAVEAMVNIQIGDPMLDLDLSEQQLVSCCRRGCNGCHGGNSYYAWQYLIDNDGAILESAFPYYGIDANGCDSWKTNDCNEDPITCDMKEDGWDELTIPLGEIGYYDNADFELMEYVLATHGPAVTYMLVYSDFKYYNGGIYEHGQNADLVGGHAVMIVGYDEENNYLICKNSWGPFWGEDGYFRVPFGECMLGEQLYFIEIDEEKLNFPPHAETAGPYNGEVNESIQFYGDESNDLDDNIESFIWDFGDGSTSSYSNPTHSYKKKGIYPVTLTVIDSFGKQSTDETVVFIDTWDLNDHWKYNVSFDTIPDALYPPIRFPFDGNIPDLTLTVVEEKEDTYVLDVSGSLSGKLSLNFDIQHSIFDFRVWSKIIRGRIDGSIELDKKGLGLDEFEVSIKGLANNIALPILPIPLWIPAPFDVTIRKTFNESRPLMNRAPDVGKSMNIPSSNSNSEMIISLFFGIVSNAFQNGEFIHETTYSCVESDEIVTPAGRFNGYQYSIDSSNEFKESDFFFAPSINNVVRFSGGDTELYTYNGELISTNVN